MKSRYVDLQTGEVISAKQLLAFEKGKDRIWEAAEEMRSLLLNIAEAGEEQAQHLLMEAQAIRECVKKYDAAEGQLDKREAGHLATERSRAIGKPPNAGDR
jgi:uncharacterized protein YPO0396